MMKLLFIHPLVKFLAIIFISTSLQAAEIEVQNPWVKLPFPGMKMTGGYMKLINKSEKDIRLLKVTGDDCEAYEIHTHTKVEGIMKMRQVKDLLIKAHDTVTLKPKSFHIMMIQLKEKIKIGQLMKMTLHFDHGGSIEVTAPVKKHNP